MSRHFQFMEGNSCKFWEVSVADSDVTVRFGRIGTPGQSQTKSLPDSAAAAKHAEKLIAEKLKRATSSPPPDSPPAAAFCFSAASRS